jgi:hypothetical protein
MMATVIEMADQRDATALNDMWRVLGGKTSLRLGTDEDWQAAATLINSLIHDTCGGSKDPFLSERKAMSEIARNLKIDARSHSTIEELGDALVDEASRRIQKKLAAMSEEERTQFFEDLLRRMRDDERIGLVDELVEAYERMAPDEQEDFVRRMAAHMGVEEDAARAALAGGTAALVPLMIADQSGFAVFLLTTKLMYSTFSFVGVTLPIGAYIAKN